MRGMALANQHTQNAGATSIFSFWIVPAIDIFGLHHKQKHALRASMVAVQANNNQASGVASLRQEEKKGTKNKQHG
jgi:hypothetical protein